MLSYLAKRKLPAAVIDTETGFVKLGLAKKLAKKMEASYFRVDNLSEDSLLRVWRKMSGEGTGKIGWIMNSTK